MFGARPVIIAGGSVWTQNFYAECVRSDRDRHGSRAQVVVGLFARRVAGFGLNGMRALAIVIKSIYGALVAIIASKVCGNGLVNAVRHVGSNHVLGARISVIARSFFGGHALAVTANGIDAPGESAFFASVAIMSRLEGAADVRVAVVARAGVAVIAADWRSPCCAAAIAWFRHPFGAFVFDALANIAVWLA